MENETLIKNIKALCKKKGITVHQLEKQLGLASGTLARFKNTSPSISRVANIANELGVTIDELVYGENTIDDKYSSLDEKTKAIVEKIYNKTKYNSLVWKIFDNNSYDEDATNIRNLICNKDIYSDNEVYFAEINADFFLFQVEYNDTFNSSTSELRLYTLSANDSKPVIVISQIMYLLPLYNMISEKVVKYKRRKKSESIIEDFMNND